MKVPESGMPEETYWESLFDIDGVLRRLGIDGAVGDVAELGCGYGTFTLPVARRVAGTVHTFDIEPDMIERTKARARSEGGGRIDAVLRDVLADGFGLGAGTCDACLLFNILHFPGPEVLLREAARVIRPGGRVLAMHWRSDIETPRGPPLAIRPRPEQMVSWGEAAGLRAGPVIGLPPWHFGVAMRKG